MIAVVVLGLWAVSGTILAAILSPGPGRWAWTPLAALLGPLWLPVVVDQRAAPASRSGHPR